VPADDNFVADTAAEELRERLKQLAKQVVDMQVGNAIICSTSSNWRAAAAGAPVSR
jgi:hypothetical protein